MAWHGLVRLATRPCRDVGTYAISGALSTVPEHRCLWRRDFSSSRTLSGKSLSRALFASSHGADTTAALRANDVRYLIQLTGSNTPPTLSPRRHEPLSHDTSARSGRWLDGGRARSTPQSPNFLEKLNDSKRPHLGVRGRTNWERSEERKEERTKTLTRPRCPRSHASIALRSSMTCSNPGSAVPVSGNSATSAASLATSISRSRYLARGRTEWWVSLAVPRRAASTCFATLVLAGGEGQKNAPAWLCGKEKPGKRLVGFQPTAVWKRHKPPLNCRLFLAN